MPEPKREHTPGPWSIHSGTAADPEGHIWKDGRLIASCMGHSDGTWETHLENAANAILIAVAPNYHEHAQTIVEWWDHGTPPPVPEHVAKAFCGLRSALAKAKGEPDAE